MARVPLVREATETDFEALTKLDLSYTVGERHPDLERSGRGPEPNFSLRVRTGAAGRRTGGRRRLGRLVTEARSALAEKVIDAGPSSETWVSAPANVSLPVLSRLNRAIALSPALLT